MKPLSFIESRLAPASGTSIWGAFVAGVLAGGIGMTRETRSKNWHKADIVAMYVLPEYARQGLGRALLDHAIGAARAQGLEQLVLTVTQTNVPARELYAAAGFVTFGVEPRAIKVDGAYFAKEHMALWLGSA